MDHLWSFPKLHAYFLKIVRHESAKNESGTTAVK